MKIKDTFTVAIVLFFFTIGNIGAAPTRLTLPQAIQMALKQNPATRIASSRIAEAEAKIEQARAYKLPHLNLLTKYFYTNNLPNMYPQGLKKIPVMSPSGPLPNEFVPLRPMAPFPGNQRDVFKFDVNLVFPFYTGGKITTANRNARELKNLFQKNLVQTKAELAYKVRIAFYNVLFLNKVIQVYQKGLHQLNQHMELAQKAYEQGVRSRFDILQFQSKIEEFKSKIVNLQGKLVTAQTALKNLLNLPLSDTLNVVGDLDTFRIKIDTTQNIFRLAQENNMQLQMLSSKETLYENLKRIHQADLRPKLFAFANFHVYHGMDFPPYDEGWRNGWATGIGVSFNLFDGQLTRGKIEEAEANKVVVQNQREGLALRIRFQITSALENMHSLSSELRALNKTLQVAQEGYKIARVSYENGVITNVQLEDAHLNILRIQVKILKVKKLLLEQEAQIRQLLGKYE